MTHHGTSGEAQDVEHAHRAHNERPIALTGFMGVGKSTIGRIVAKELGRPFLDSDSVIAFRLKTSITALFERGEEAAFRSAEVAVIKELVTSRPIAVIALGGGALESEVTRELVVNECVLVHLAQPFSDIERALPSLRRNRPLLRNRSDEEIHRLYLSRQENYELAHITVHSKRVGVARAASEVIAAIRTSRVASDEQVGRNPDGTVTR